MKNKLLCDPSTGQCFMPSQLIEIEINDDHAFFAIKERLLNGGNVTADDVECATGGEGYKTQWFYID